jgi:sortase (surface protein transpeptidase)
MRLGLAVLLAGVALLWVAAALALLGNRSGPPVGASVPRLENLAVPVPVVARHSRHARRSRHAHSRMRPKRRPPRPARLEIPAIGVRAPVIPLGLKPDRSLEVPRRFDQTGWWTGGPRPGEPGPAVIAGHVDSTDGPAVFYRLSDLRRGAVIAVVRRDGSRARFTVQRSERYPKAHFPTARVYAPTRGPTLRLITCGGAFDHSTGHYVDNTVVYAVAA